MSRLLFVSSILIFANLAHAFLVDEQLMANCRSTNNGLLSNDFFLGEWFEVMSFTLFGGLPASTSCTSNVYTKAGEDNVTSYIENYNNPTPSMDDNPVIVSRRDGAFIYLVTGHMEAKDYYIQPNSGFALSHTINNYKRLNDDYMLVWDCQLRGNTIWLHSRIRTPTAEEIAAVIAGVSEVERLVPQRYCAAS